MVLKAVDRGFKITAKKHQTQYIYERFKTRICICHSSNSVHLFMARPLLGVFNASCFRIGGVFL
jgi:hypothetical protein